MYFKGIKYIICFQVELRSYVPTCHFFLLKVRGGVIRFPNPLAFGSQAGTLSNGGGLPIRSIAPLFFCKPSPSFGYLYFIPIFFKALAGFHGFRAENAYSL